MMTYREYINAILSMRENSKRKDIYMERHHIIPKCMGGDNSPENLIWLFPKEHFMAHKLLYLENKTNNKLAFAYWSMCGGRKGKRNISQVCKNEARKAWYNALFGINGIKLKKCICLENGCVYDSIKDAGLANGIKPQQISKVLHNTNRTIKGLHFDFYDEKKHTKEYCEKELKRRIENKKKACHPTKKSIERMHEARRNLPKGYFNKVKSISNRKVVCFTNGKIYDKMADAMRDTGCREQDIYAVCSGRQKTTHGYSFSYYGDKK